MESPLERSIAERLESWRGAGLERTLFRPAAAAEREFTSNDYLGFRGRRELAAAAVAAVERYGVGAGASRLLGGGCRLDQEVESLAATWLGVEAALLFATGYQANLGLITSLAERGDVLFSDRLNHASLIDASRLAGAEVRIFEHCDTDHLAQLLHGARAARRRLVVTEGVFSMDGDVAPLVDLHELCERHDAHLLVDEAHAGGLLGRQGAGACQAAGLGGAQRLAARVVTGGKALGVAGAVVACSAAVRNLLVQRARSFVFTTGVPPPVSGALLAAIELCRTADGERRRALDHAALLAERLGLPAPGAAIVPFVVGESRAAMRLAEDLRRAKDGAEGFEVRAVRPPTVPEGTARLRLACHAGNSRAAVEELAARLAEPPVPPALTVERRLSPLVVVGTDTGVGKTVVSALLARAAAPGAAYWKPVQTGAESDTDEVRRLVEGADVELLEPAHAFALPASPHHAAAAENGAVDPERLRHRLYRYLSRPGGRTLVVELAGGLLVPLLQELTQADWLVSLDPRPRLALVARSGLGTLNHTHLTLEALRARRLLPAALFLVGEPHAANLATLAASPGLTSIHQLPPLEPLDAAALDRWLAGRTLEELLGGSSR